MRTIHYPRRRIFRFGEPDRAFPEIIIKPTDITDRGRNLYVLRSDTGCGANQHSLQRADGGLRDGVVNATFDQVDQRFDSLRAADLTERLRRFLPRQVRFITE